MTKHKSGGSAKAGKRPIPKPADPNASEGHGKSKSGGVPAGPKGSRPDKHGGSGAGRQEGGSGAGRER